MSAINNLSQRQFSHLTVLRQDGKNKHGRAMWLCRCVCGSETRVAGGNLLNESVKSCGCKKLKSGGISNTPTGVSWRAMLTRCYNKKNPCYPFYGAIGIFACEFLRASPLNMVSLIGERPDGKSIDRINSFLSYTCGQCAGMPGF